MLPVAGEAVSGLLHGPRHSDWPEKGGHQGLGQGGEGKPSPHGGEGREGPEKGEGHAGPQEGRGKAGAADRLSHEDQILAGDLQDHQVRTESPPPPRLTAGGGARDNGIRAIMKKALILIAVLALAASLGAQSLADLAKQEKARRESLRL